MNCGKIEDWVKEETGYTCSISGCDLLTAWRSKSMDNGDGLYYFGFCPACYIEKVVIPNSAPIESVSDDLIGREVVCLDSTKYTEIETGKTYFVRKEHGSPFLAIGYGRWSKDFIKKYFRLLPEPTKEPIGETTTLSINGQEYQFATESNDEPIPYTVVEPFAIPVMCELVTESGFDCCENVSCDAGKVKLVVRGNGDKELLRSKIEDHRPLGVTVDLVFADEQIIKPATFDVSVKFDDIYCGPSSITICETDKDLQAEIPCTETTHSAVLEFPNGDQITIPAPEGEGWTGKETRYNWPVKYYRSGFIKASKVRHENGTIIYKEYYNRMKAENPRIVSITKWTRIKPDISKTETTVTDWRGKYPLLNGVEW